LKLLLTLKPFGSNLILIEKHEKGQSRYNYLFDYDDDEEMLSHKRVWVIKKLKERRNEKVNTKKHHCIEDNSQLFTKCMNNFIMEQLNCRLPWLQAGGYTGNYHRAILGVILGAIYGECNFGTWG
jgi:hypothetical protein